MGIPRMKLNYGRLLLIAAILFLFFESVSTKSFVQQKMLLPENRLFMPQGGVTRSSQTLMRDLNGGLSVSPLPHGAPPFSPPILAVTDFLRQSPVPVPVPVDRVLQQAGVRYIPPFTSHPPTL